jgi:Fe-S-cluster containining protein
LSETLRAALPPIYKDLLSPEFDRPVVHETRATCDDCEMCDKGTMPPGVEAVYFRPDTKCCTYHPSLANYLVGAILRDPSPEMAEGKRRIRERIASRIGVVPYCLAPAPKYLLLYNASKATAFGRSAALRCPYLTEDSRCSIWRHRESICSTFFCKYDAGEAGVLFWRAFKAYLSHAESSLAVWSTKSIARDVQQPRWKEDTITVEDLEDRPPDDTTYARTWGSWVGREEEFYIACYNKVRNLSRLEFAKIVDETVKGRETLSDLRARYASLMTPKLPERLALNKKLRRLPVANGVVVTTSYNVYDSMVLEKDLFDMLEKFSHDSTVAETRKRLEEEHGIEFTDELLIHLSRHAIVVEPPSDTSVESSAKKKSKSKKR